jgi:protein TonB
MQECGLPDMETTMSTSDPRDGGTGHATGPRPEALAPARNARDWRPSLRVLLSVVAAFAIGALLFMALWWRDRGNDFYRAQGIPPAAESQQFEPLPAPAPGGRPDGIPSDTGETPIATDMPPPRAIQPRPAPTPRPAPPLPPERALSTRESTPPAPIQSPAPTYPPAALRNRESGTVLLRVHVDTSGNPYAVDLLKSSRSRSLDRAAAEAVKRWRFRPAMQGGSPVPGEVQVPITFNAER